MIKKTSGILLGLAATSLAVSACTKKNESGESTRGAGQGVTSQPGTTSVAGDGTTVTTPAAGATATTTDAASGTAPVAGATTPAGTTSVSTTSDTANPASTSTALSAGGEVVGVAQLASATGGKESGAVTIRSQGGRAASSLGVRLTVKGLTPGAHGFHIHEKGDCSDPLAKSMGEHWNPGNKAHGPATGEARHAGDLGNVTVDANGNGEIEVQLPGAAGVSGGLDKAVVGKSVVVHEKADDLSSQPAGNAGNPVLCGVIKESETPAAH